MLFKDISIFSSGGHLFSGMEWFVQMMVEGILRNLF